MEIRKAVVGDLKEILKLVVILVKKEHEKYDKMLDLGWIAKKGSDFYKDSISKNSYCVFVAVDNGAPKGVPPAQMASADADKVGNGIEEVVEIDSIERLHANRVCSMHDFDLGYNLKLLKKVGKIDSVRIIGVPMGIGEDLAINQIQSILRKWAAQDMQGS